MRMTIMYKVFSVLGDAVVSASRHRPYLFAIGRSRACDCRLAIWSTR